MISLYDLLEASNGQLFGEPAVQLFSDFSFDSRGAQDSCLFVTLKSEHGDGHQYMQEAVANGATGLLCNVPPNFDTDQLSVILVKDPAAALMAWVSFVLRKFGTRIIAVTGSAGKSVTSQAIQHVLESRFPVYWRDTTYEGRLNLPLMLAKLKPEHKLAVVELNLNHAGDITEMIQVTRPDVGVVTSVGYGHGDAFSTLEQVAHEQRQLVEALPLDGLAVLNYDDDLAREMAVTSRARVLTIGVERFGADLMAYSIILGATGTGFDLRYNQQRLVGRWIPLLGKHQLHNALCALAVGLYYGVPLEEGLKAIKGLHPLHGRMNPLKGINGSMLIDDSLSATPQAMLAGLEWLNALTEEGRRAIFVMGDMDRLGAFSQRGHRMVGQRAAEVADLIVTQGADAALAGRAALDQGFETRALFMTYNTADAIARLTEDMTLTADDIVLVTGGSSARMEQVVRALLADKRDSMQLPRHESVEEEALTTALPLRPSWVEVDLSALAHNVRGIKTLIGKEITLMAVVKADAYGSGAVAVARTALLNGAEYLAVASINEALELREAGIIAPILVMSYTPVPAARHAIRQDITLTVYDFDLARAYDAVAQETNARLRIHVKIDTGIGRLGLLPKQATSFFRQILGLQHLEIEGIYTHFSAADSDPAYTAEQVRIFKGVVKPLQASGFRFKHIHAANSAGMLSSPDNHFNMVRVGLAMHGLSPSETVRVPDDFRPVLSWKTVIAQVKTLPPGHPVGYGNTYITQDEETIAIIPVGYADGFRRAPSNWGEVLVHGQRAPLVGRVSMEKSAINVSHIEDVTIGDEVVLLGTQGDETISADDIARRLQTINYEVLCSILPRVPRR